MTDARNYFQDLYELGGDRSMSIEEKIESAITVGRDRLGVPYGVLSYTGGGEYEIIDSTLSSGPYTPGSVQELETTWCRHVAGDREPLAIADAEESARADDAAYREAGLQCYIGAPITINGESFGTLCYSGEEPRETPFTDDERRFVELLARWISSELEREHHYQTLNAQNKRLDEFAGVLAHDLRNPLAAARGYTELAAESVAKPERAHLQTALEGLDRMETLIGETLTLAREGTDVGERRPVDLADTAQAAWDTVEPATAALSIVANRTVLADGSQLQRLFANLFRNVEQHCGGSTTVTVRGTDDGFAVADDGPGLPPETAESLFAGQGELSRNGLGLLVVERVTDGHGWTGAVEIDGGTEFVFSNAGAVSAKPQL